MARRYYLAKIRFSEEGGVESWRHRLQDGEFGSQAYEIIHTGTDQNQPYSLCMVGAVNHVELRADPELVGLPDVGLDQKIETIGAVAKAELRAKIAAVGEHSELEVETVWNPAYTYRQAIEYYGKLNDPNFDSNTFDTADT